MNLTEQTRVVVLGGTSGIGLAVAHAAAARGAQVVIGSRSRASVDTALAALPAGAVGRAVDATSSADVALFLAEAAPFDHFVYTAAGRLRSRLLADITPEFAHEFLAVRVTHALDAVRLAVPYLRPTGSITLVSGTAAFKGGAGWALGAAASGAIVSAARSLAVELAPLRVNAVAPGVVRSPLWTDLPVEDREGLYTAVGDAVPLGRVAEVEDVARVYVGLMEQDYVTGTVSVVDGGTLVV